MNASGLATIIVLALGFAAPASAIDILVNPAAVQAAARVGMHPGLAALPAQAALPPAPASELPEPDVVAMMLLGLILIGYKASRDSDEKFS